MAATANDAFCAIADVEAFCGRGAFGVSTNPTSQEVLEFMAQRSGQVESTLHHAGYAYTTPAGGTPFSGGTDEDRALGWIARNACARGAAADALMANTISDDPDVPAKVLRLLTEWTDALESITNYSPTTTAAGAAVVLPGAVAVTGGVVTLPDVDW